MLLPLIVAAALVNIIAKTNNYNIKTTKNRNFEMRVRRHADLDSVLYRRIVGAGEEEEVGGLERTEAVGGREPFDIRHLAKKLNLKQSLEGTARNKKIIHEEDSEEISKNFIKSEEGDGFHTKNVIDPKPRRAKRLASLGSGVSDFFSNIYNKMYDLTHSQTEHKTHSAYTDFNTYNNASYYLNNQPLYNYSANNNSPTKSYTSYYSNPNGYYPYNSYYNNNLSNYNGPYHYNPGYNPSNSNNYYNQNAYPNNNLNNPGYVNNYSNYHSNPYGNPNGYNPYNSYYDNFPNNNLAYDPYPGYNSNNYNQNNNLNNPVYKNNYSDYANAHNQNNSNVNMYSNNGLTDEITGWDNDGEDTSSTTEMIINQGMILGGIGCPRNHRRVAFVCVPIHG